MKLSIIVPVFNEEKTIKIIIKKLQKLKLDKVSKEIIIVDDGSTDKTSEIIQKFAPEVLLIKHKINKGKGNAVRTGIKISKGDMVVIQDADLEYDPLYIRSLLEPIFTKKAQVVYGTRLRRMPNFRSDERTIKFFSHYVGNKILSLLFSFLFNQWLTDIETGYKLISKSALKKIKLNSTGFEFEPEITAKLCRLGYKIHEVPIRTVPRSISEGKKLRTIEDGFKSLFAILKYRIVS